MEYGVFVFGGVEMPDAGAGAPAPMDRRYDAKQIWEATERLLALGVKADECGFDSYWFTEHHFQYEGYEVLPNGVMFSAILAERTRRIRIGAMFNVITQWHPLRFAEDFATMHNLSGGRGILGVGRGTVPREGENLGTVIGSADNPDQAAHDALNREQFDEALEVIRTALDNDTFSFQGKHFRFPARPIPDRGTLVDHLTLVPRPLYPYEIWQPISTPNTLKAVPRKGIGGVFWQLHHSILEQWWQTYGDLHAEAFPDEPLGRGDKRMVVLNVKIGDTHEAAIAAARPGHDEFWKFLGPYGWSRGYVIDGAPAPAGLIPTLEQSLEQKSWLVGTAEEVAEGIAFLRERLGVQRITLFPQFLGDSFDATEEQLERFARDVKPLIA
jgi:alkanesulfonate monooxygenase SsuD/methylene tetrahydromethanopterin reductase-like flavin-dependent oxidoreductase (luciferase family)